MTSQRPCQQDEYFSTCAPKPRSVKVCQPLTLLLWAAPRATTRFTPWLRVEKYAACRPPPSPLGSSGRRARTARCEVLKQAEKKKKPAPHALVSAAPRAVMRLSPSRRVEKDAG